MARSKKADTSKILMNGAMAFGGGIAAELVSDLIAKNAPEIVQENPKVTELAPAGVGLGLLFFMPGKADPLAYGMIGASGAGMADDILPAQGFNRMNLQGTADELAKGKKYIDSLLKKGFGDSPSSGGMNGTDGDGMSY